MVYFRATMITVYAVILAVLFQQGVFLLIHSFIQNKVEIFSLGKFPFKFELNNL